MKTCPGCGAQTNDEAAFCTKCGAKFQEQEAEYTYAGNASNVNNNYTANNQNFQGGYAAAPQIDPYDHTSEFSAKDISDNKVFAMLVYLMGTVGIIIALLGSQSSPYAGFHVRQALKIVVLDILIGICTLLLFWTIIVPIAAAIAFVVLFVVKIICFFSICNGNAKEPPIVRSFGFLR